MDLGLAGKNVIVTGGASNIGRAISLTFAQEGANVAIVDLDVAQGQKTADEANGYNAGGKSIVHKMDVTDWPLVQETFKKIHTEFGGIDILVNNVGWEMVMFFVDTTPDFWDRIIAINYKGVIHCTKAVIPYMLDQKSGAVVNIGSDAGRMGDAREAVYGGCKAGVINFTKSVARENGRFGIRLNTVCPGATVPVAKTDVGEGSMWGALGPDAFPDDMREKWSKNYALKRLGTAQEVANGVVFLASSRASFITGQTLSVSGGYSMM